MAELLILPNAADGPHRSDTNHDGALVPAGTMLVTTVLHTVIVLHQLVSLPD